MVRINFANKIACKNFEGTYVTIFTSFNNLGRKLSDSAYLYIADYVNFNYSVYIGWIYSIFVIVLTKDKLKKFRFLKKEDWELNQTKSIKSSNKTK